MRTAHDPPRTPTVFTALGLSWLGLAIHNWADLGAQVLPGPETVAPTAVTLLLAAAWMTPARRPAAGLMLVWGWLNLIGGGLLSVLPIPLWPFQPEQTLHHYAIHVIYTALQIPLVITLHVYLRRSSTSPTSSPRTRNASPSSTPRSETGSCDN